MAHIQEDSSLWESASDEQHLQGLFKPPAFPDPAWMGYLKQNRPHLITRYLNLHQQSGGYIGKSAKNYLRRRI